MKYQLQAMNQEIDIFTILDTLNSIKEQVNSVDCRVNDTLMMVYNRTLQEHNNKQSDTAREKHNLEDEKTQEKDQLGNKINAAPKFEEDNEKKVHKDEVKSINKILSLEIDKIVNQVHAKSSEKESDSKKPIEGLENQLDNLISLTIKNRANEDNAATKTKDSTKNNKEPDHQDSIMSKDSKLASKVKVDSLLKSFENMDMDDNK